MNLLPPALGSKSKKERRSTGKVSLKWMFTEAGAGKGGPAP